MLGWRRGWWRNLISAGLALALIISMFSQCGRFNLRLIIQPPLSFNQPGLSGEICLWWYYNMLVLVFFVTFSKWNVQWVVLKVCSVWTWYETDVCESGNVLLLCAYRGPLEMLENNIPPTLNSTLNLTDSVHKNICEIKTKASMLFELSLWAILWNDLWLMFRGTQCNAVPGELPGKFTTSEKPYTWSRLCDAQSDVFFFKSCTM